MNSILETIASGSDYLAKKGIDSPRLNMEHLIAHSLGCTRMDLYAQFDQPLHEAQLVPLRKNLKSRGEGIPLQHLLRTISFLGRDFLCDARALIPRPETEELAELLCKKFPSDCADVLDLGCGSGVIGLSIAGEFPDSKVFLADISEEALCLCRENRDQLGLKNTQVIESNLFSNLNDQFDLIVANLPYVPEKDRSGMDRELSHDPALALFSGPDGLDLLRRLISEAPTYLKTGALLALEIGHDQASQIITLLEESGFRDIQVLSDLSGIPRFPIARKI